MLLDITDYTTITPTRVLDEANNTRTPITPIDAVWFLSEPVAVVTERGKRWIQNGILRTRKGCDLKDGDEVPLPEGTFGVVGGPMMNRLHSMTGSDFGWVRYAIRKGG
jgi:hypothetical protein